MCVLRAEEDYPSLGVNPRSRQAREAFPRTEKHGMAFLFLNFAGTCQKLLPRVTQGIHFVHLFLCYQKPIFVKQSIGFLQKE